MSIQTLKKYSSYILQLHLFGLENLWRWFDTLSWLPSFCRYVCSRRWSKPKIKISSTAVSQFSEILSNFFSFSFHDNLLLLFTIDEVDFTFLRSFSKQTYTLFCCWYISIYNQLLNFCYYIILSLGYSRFFIYLRYLYHTFCLILILSLVWINKLL